MRWEVLRRFREQVKPLLPDIKTVALVGGSDKDWEIQEFRAENYDVTYLGIEAVPENNFIYFDMNKLNNIGKQFDLVICSQVLEHIYDVKVGIENLLKLANTGGTVWINCPYSNHSHGSPEFYSSGYSPKLIIKLAELLGATTIFSAQLGSKRQYFFTHSIQYWPTEHEYLHPMRIIFSRYILSQFFWRILASAQSPEVTNHDRSATETIVMLKK